MAEIATNPRRAMTLIEALVVVAALSIVCAVTLVLLVPRHSHHRINQIVDSARLREIGRGFTKWSESGIHRAPLPSRLDADNATIDAPARTKDTTAAILASLISIGLVTIEQCVSAAEVNPRIVPDRDYRFGDIPEAPSPTGARWDPAFSADFTGASTGNVSFAFLQPAGGRLTHWTSHSPDRTPFAANRGPEITGVGVDGNPTLRNAKSATFRIHSNGKRWRGCVGFLDGSVTFEESLAPRSAPGPLLYTRADGSRAADLLFFDEPDDPAATNAYLGIFIRAGERPADFQAIWD